MMPLGSAIGSRLQFEAIAKIIFPKGRREKGAGVFLLSKGGLKFLLKERKGLELGPKLRTIW